MRILFLTYIPAPYRVALFNELGKNCDLTVVFEKESASHRDKSWKKYSFDFFKGIVLSGTKDKIMPNFQIVDYLKSSQYDFIIVHNPSTPTGMLAIQYMKNHRIKYWIESDGGFAKNGKGIKEAIKRHFLGGADGYFSTCDSCDTYLIQYGADNNRIFRYPFAVPRINDDGQEQKDKEFFRNELGIKENRVVLAVGQFIPRKGFDVLIQAIKDIKSEFGAYFIGGKVTDEYRKLVCDLDIKNIHFIEFKDSSILKKYYMASDVFVLPTREDIWGLVINEAMSYGLPVITTNRCGAGTELIKSGENGYLVEVEDSFGLSAIMSVLLDNQNLCNYIGKNARDTIDCFTIENMAKAHLEILEKDVGNNDK